MKILRATIYRGVLDLPIDGASVEEVIYVKDRDGGIASVKDAILHRLGTWPTNKVTGAAVKVLADVQLAAMRILDRTFVARCPFSMSQVDSILGIEDADTFEWF